MKAFCMDVHISIIEDFKKNCPTVEVVDWCLSGHAWVLKRQQDCPLHVNASTWRGFNPKMIEDFRKQYDGFLRSFDMFIVGYASCFAMIYEPYGKPILMMNAVRYDVPFCWTNDTFMLHAYHDCLNRLHKARRLIIVSNNKADQLYLELGCSLTSQHIPSLCLYTGIQYAPTRDTFLVYSGKTPSHPLITQKPSQPFEWSDLGSFRGIIHIPYEISTMSMFEHFSAGLPIFVPSKTFWFADPSIQSMSAYWGDRSPARLAKLRDIRVWIEQSDIYTTFSSPNVQFFDSFEHLFSLLESFIYVDTTEFHKDYVKRIQTKWDNIIQDVKDSSSHGSLRTGRFLSM
jgi:hypothetical protein